MNNTILKILSTFVEENKSKLNRQVEDVIYWVHKTDKTKRICSSPESLMVAASSGVNFSDYEQETVTVDHQSNLRINLFGEENVDTAKVARTLSNLIRMINFTLDQELLFNPSTQQFSWKEKPQEKSEFDKAKATAQAALHNAKSGKGSKSVEECEREYCQVFIDNNKPPKSKAFAHWELLASMAKEQKSQLTNLLTEQSEK